MTKSILVITDRHEQDNCSLAKAHDIAAPLGADLHIVRFLTGDDPQGDESVAHHQALLSSSINQIFADYPNKALIKTQVVTTEDIADWVVAYCETHPIDLIVKTGHRSESLFHTPCDWELIRNSAVPVLFANRQRWNSKHAVMAAIDPTAKDAAHKELNERILNWTREWAHSFNCEAHILYSMPVSKFLQEFDIIELSEYERKHRAEAQEKLDSYLSKFDLPNVKTHVTAGSPEKTIPHWANEFKAELVIMGCVGRKGLKNLLKGNVAEKVMHHLRTDSLIVENAPVKTPSAGL